MIRQIPARRHIVVIIFFLACSAAASLMMELSSWNSNSKVQLLYLFVTTGIILIYAFTKPERETKITFDDTPYTKAERVGLLFYGFAIAAEALYFSSWFRIITENPETLLRLKYVILSLPLAAGLGLALYLPENRHIAKNGRSHFISSIFRVAIPGIGFGFIMYLLSGFEEWRVFAVMTMVGALIRLGQLITGKFYITLTTLFLVIYANALSLGRFAGFSWLLASAGFLFCCTLLFMTWTRSNRLNSYKTSSC